MPDDTHMTDATDRDTPSHTAADLPQPGDAVVAAAVVPETVAAEPVKLEAAPVEAVAAPPVPAPERAAETAAVAPPAISDLASPAATGPAPRISARSRIATLGAGTASRLRVAAAAPYARPLASAAALLVAVGLGFGGARLLPRAERMGPDISAQRWSDAAVSLRQSHDDVTHLGAELKSLKTAVDAVKVERDRARGELAARQAQLSEKTEKLGAETATRLARLTEQLDRIEKTQRDPSRLGALAERLERIEKQLQTGPGPVAASLAPAPAPVAAAAPTPPPKPVAAADTVMQTGSLPDAKPAAKAPAAESDPRKMPLDGYVLRDLDEGEYALVEARNGRVYEVAPGRMLPGVGRVEAIERRGRRWVVVTPKGYIAER